MKRKLLGFLFCLIFALACALGLTGCVKDGGHTHQWGTTLTQGTDTHWYACSGCEEKKDEVAHRYTDGVCVCGKEEPIVGHTHDWKTAWSKDDTKHWHGCNGCDEIKDEDAHSYTDGVCACGYEHNHDWKAQLSKDSAKHWLECNGCDKVKDEVAHSYTDGVCACGYEHDHDWKTQLSKDATKHWSECNGCDKVKDEVAHSYTDGVCACGYEHNHDWNTELWCVDEGKHWHDCNGCDKKKDEESHSYTNRFCVCGQVEPHEHTYGEWQTEAVLTCTENGIKKRLCSFCNQWDREVTVASGHSFTVEDRDEQYLVREAACTGAVYQKSCAVCGAAGTETFEYGEAVDSHSFDEHGICTVCDLDTQYLNAYNGTYGYEYFSTVENGTNYRKLYMDIDNWARNVHVTNQDVAFLGDTVRINFADYDLTNDQAIAVWKTYKDDHPLYYWISNTLTIINDAVIELIIQSEYVSAEQRNTYTELVYNKVEEYSARISPTDGAYNLALAFHDFIIDEIDYAYNESGSPESAEWAHNIIGVMQGKGAVCEGYARSFQLLLNYHGVESLFVTGMGGGESHAWNLVRLDDGNWYWFDLTFDDLADWKGGHRNDAWGIRYDYFAANDESFFYDHTPSSSAVIEGVTFLYELPARATSAFTAEYPLLNHQFESDGAKYTVVGYRAVRLNSIERKGEVVLPESVSCGGVDYTLISVGKVVGGFTYSVLNQEVIAVTVPKTVRNICSDAFRVESLQNIVVDDDNPYFTSLDGALFTKSLYTLIQYPLGSTRTEYVIPNDTYIIASGAITTKKPNQTTPRGKIPLEKLFLGENLSSIGAIGYFDGGVLFPDRHATELQNIRESLSGEGKIIVSEENPHYASNDSMVCNKAFSYIYCIFDESLVEFTVPATTSGFELGLLESLKFLERFLLEDEDAAFSVRDGILYDCDQTTIIFVPRAMKGHVILPDTLTSISAGAFASCSGLTNIEIPDSVTSIGGGAFEGCSGLTSIELPNGVTRIGDHAFSGCSGLTSMEIPNGVTSIGIYAFEGCSGLTSIEIPDNVTYLGYCAFRDCLNLTSVKLPSGLTIIDDSVFSGCRSLTSIEIPDEVTSIGRSAFFGCSSLTSIEIPDSVISIGDLAFMWCDNMTSLKIGNGVKSIGNHAFSTCRALTSVELPDSLISIGEHAFSDCTGLTSLKIGNGVESIGDYAFNFCPGLTTIELPNGLISIGNHAFSSCTELTSINIPSSVTSIGEGAFAGCNNLISIEFPDGVASIDSDTFSCCDNLTSIKIGSGVTSIGSMAFYDCRKLTRMDFNGTKAQWNDIAKEDNWDLYTGDGHYTVYCTDGTIEK